MKRIARIFPRRTAATPMDELAFINEPPGLFPPKVDEVHISVAFTYDLPRAEWLARQWEHVAPVKIGGPATGERGENFMPGRYLKPGYVITSRGCPNRCWFCSVWKREGDVRELPITEGYNLLDDNLLACSENHIGEVLKMLSEQKRAAEFTGGLEAARLTKYIAAEIKAIKPKQLFFAYDSPEKYEALEKAVGYCWQVGFTPESHSIRAFVLIGFPKDTFESAEQRLQAVKRLGIAPMAMLWREETGIAPYEWRKFQRSWARPAAIYAKARIETTNAP